MTIAVDMGRKATKTNKQMYKIIYQQNLENGDFHNLKKHMFKKLLAFYEIEIKLAHVTTQ